MSADLSLSPVDGDPSPRPMAKTGNRRCSARSTRTKEPCQAWAVAGATVCVAHGGAAGQVRAKAKRRQQDAQAARAVVQYGLSRTVDPLDALVEELHRTAGHVAWLGEIVAQLDEVMAPSFGGLAPSAWVRLYQGERDRLTRVAAECLKAGIEERRVRIAEDQAVLLASAMRRFAELLGHDTSAPEVRTAFRASLQLVQPAD